MSVADVIYALYNDGGAAAPYRIANLRDVIDNIPDDVNVIVLEHGVAGREKLGKSALAQVHRSIDYVWVTGETFNKQFLFNKGAFLAKTDHLFFSDADVSVSAGYFWRVLSTLETHSVPWAFGWNDLKYLDPSGAVIGQSKPIRRYTEGGLVYFYKPFFFRIGGFNDWMEEVAGGDNEIIRRAEYVTDSYNILAEPARHLWHPESNIKQNKSRFRKINQDIHEAAQDFPDEMIALLSSIPPNEEKARAQVRPWPNTRIALGFTGTRRTPTPIEEKIYGDRVDPLCRTSVRQWLGNNPLGMRVGRLGRRLLPYTLKRWLLSQISRE